MCSFIHPFYIHSASSLDGPRGRPEGPGWPGRPGRGAGPFLFEQPPKGACLVLGPNYYCPYHYYINRVIRMLSSSLFNYVLISSSFYFYFIMVLSWAACGAGPGGRGGRAGRPEGPGQAFFKQPHNSPQREHV